MKRVFLLLAVFMMLLSSQSFKYAKSSDSGPKPTNILVFMNGQKLQFSRSVLNQNGRLLVPTRATFEKMGASVNWYPSNQLVEVIKDNVKVTMKIGSTSITSNGITKKTDVAPILSDGMTMVPLRLLALEFSAQVTWDSSSNTASIMSKSDPLKTSRGVDTTLSKFIVVVDAGHGGSQTGATYGGVLEKNLNLDIAKRLNALLMEDRIKTYMTRTGDSTVSLGDRSGLANRVNADLFISIHNNAFDPGENGTMTLYYPSVNRTKGNLTEKTLAVTVQNELIKALGTKDLGIIPRSGLKVLNSTKMPAILAEIGYMTYPKELDKLKTASFRQKAAEALNSAILKALKKI